MPEFIDAEGIILGGRAKISVFPLISLASLIFLLTTSAHAESSITSQKLYRVAKALVDGANIEKSALGKPSVAVLSFSSDATLARRRIGFAVSELLTRHFVEASVFTVVERTELDKVLSEQKLQVTGAVDTQSAVRIGKLLGAQYLVVGSVEKLGDLYAVNARLVRTENGEIVSAAYAELPAETFETEAQSYLVLVPKRQTIGLYFLLNYRNNPNHLAAYQTPPCGTVFLDITCQTTVSPKSFAMLMQGAGIRWSPLPRWMMDASVAFMQNNAVTDDVYVPSKQLHDTRSVGQGLLVKTTVNWVHPIFQSFNAMIGVGVSGYRMIPANSYFPFAIGPAFRSGIEYRWRERFGAGLFVNYDYITRQAIDTTANQATFGLNRLSLESTFAVYFSGLALPGRASQ